jgi:hypothetical protein
MATNRFQFSDDFVLKNGKVGINTADPQATLDVRGTIKADNLTVTGFATFTAYEGFLRSDYNIDESLTISNGSALSGEVIVGTGVTVTNNATDYAGQGQIESLKVYNTFTIPVGGTNDRPTKAKPGQLYYNEDFKTIEFYDGNVWRQVDNTTRSGRGVFGGGANPSNVSTIDYINISSQGNAINFGSLLTTKSALGSCSSSTRGLFGGGFVGGSVNTIDYVTIASEGNAISFGILTRSDFYIGSCSSSTRGLFVGGFNSNVIDYVEISTLGNAIDFGDIAIARIGNASCSSPTRGIFAGGNIQPTSISQKIIDYVTISSKGNAVTFGDLIIARSGLSACSSSTRGIFGGGGQSVPATILYNVIDYITLSSLGNATYFGDLVTSTEVLSATSSQIRGVFGGGGSTPSVQNTINFFTIATTGNAQDFGDLTQARVALAASSDSHGGLGGF